MGQNQSVEVNDKSIFLSSPTEDIAVTPGIENESNIQEMVSQPLPLSKKQLTYYKDELLNSNNMKHCSF